MNKDVVRRILAVRYTPKPDAAGPSWLTVLGHAKDSLWSVDLFRCESAIMRAHWVLVVMDLRGLLPRGMLQAVCSTNWQFATNRVAAAPFGRLSLALRAWARPAVRLCHQ
jgi:hypothetical protein